MSPKTILYHLFLLIELIIIINFYGAYILRNLSSEAQQNGIVNRDVQKSVSEHYFMIH